MFPLYLPEGHRTEYFLIQLARVTYLLKGCESTACGDIFEKINYHHEFQRSTLGKQL